MRVERFPIAVRLDARAIACWLEAVQPRPSGAAPQQQLLTLRSLPPEQRRAMPFTMKDAAFVSAEKEKGSVDGSAKRKLDFGSMVTLDSMPQTKRAQKKPAAAPLNVVIYKISDRAGDVWQKYETMNSAELWQVQMDHDARPCVLFSLRRSHSYRCGVDDRRCCMR